MINFSLSLSHTHNLIIIISLLRTDVIGTNSVLIKILEPIEETICTTFRGE